VSKGRFLLAYVFFFAFLASSRFKKKALQNTAIDDLIHAIDLTNPNRCCLADSRLKRHRPSAISTIIAIDMH